MSKFSLAASLADELGTSISKASRFIDEVGAPAARNTLDEAAQGASRTVEKWWKPAAAGGGIIGGGALAWRQQDLEQARAISEQEQGYSSAIESIMDSDLPPAKKRELVESLNNNRTSNDGGSGDGGDSGLFGDGIEGTLIKLLVVAMVVGFLLNYAGSSLPTVSVSGGGGA